MWALRRGWRCWAAAARPPPAAGARHVCGAHSSAAPLQLRVDAPPLVYHPLYSAPQLPAGHRFPMGVFQCIFEALLAEGVVRPEQVRAGWPAGWRAVWWAGRQAASVLRN